MEVYGAYGNLWINMSIYECLRVFMGACGGL